MKQRRAIQILLSACIFVCMLLLAAMAVRVTRERKSRDEKAAASAAAESQSIEESLSIEESQKAVEASESESAGSVLQFSATQEAGGINVASGADVSEQLSDLKSHNETAEGRHIDPNGLRIFIGDSRTVGMQNSVTFDQGRDIFICKGATNYQYFEGEAVPALEALIDSENVSEVFILMGVNDCANNCKGWTDYNVYSYIGLINKLVIKYPEIAFYFSSVGPVDGYFHGTVLIAPDELNEWIDSFNSCMFDYCGAVYIPTAEHMLEDGYKSADGIHYTKETNQMIYDYITDYAKENEK